MVQARRTVPGRWQVLPSKVQVQVEVLVLVPVPAPNCSVPCSMEIVGSSPAMLSRVCLLSSLNVPEPVLSSADRGPRAPLCCLYGALAAGGPL